MEASSYGGQGATCDEVGQSGERVDGNADLCSATDGGGSAVREQNKSCRQKPAIFKNVVDM